MLSLHSIGSARALARGFTLIEMMVAVVVGLIVTAAATSLVVAINQANSETIQSTRLNQELRTITAVIADDLKRSRRLNDPVAVILQGSAAAAGTFDTIATPTYTPANGCITYGYQGALGAAANDYTNHYSAIRLTTTNGVGSVALATGTAAVDCTTGGTTINSSQVNITGLTFNCIGGTGADSCTHAQEVDVAVSGQLQTANRISYFFRQDPVTRTITQPVFIRSISVL